MSRQSVGFRLLCVEMKDRIDAANRCVETLVPDAEPRRKRRIAKKMLTMCDGKDRSTKITQAQAEDIILPEPARPYSPASRASPRKK